MTPDTNALRERIEPLCRAALLRLAAVARGDAEAVNFIIGKMAIDLISILPNTEDVRNGALEEAAKVAEASVPGFTSRFPDIARDVKVATERALLIAERIRALSPSPLASQTKI